MRCLDIIAYTNHIKEPVIDKFQQIIHTDDQDFLDDPLDDDNDSDSSSENDLNYDDRVQNTFK